MKKKIIFSDNSLRELLNFRGDIINYYANNGYDVVLVSPKNCDYVSTSPNIKIIPTNLNRGGTNPFSDIKFFFQLLRIYYKERPNYIFHYTIKPNIFGSFAAKLCRIPSSAMIAGLGFVFTDNSFGSRIGRLLYKIALKIPEKVLVLNEYNKFFLIKNCIVPKNKIILLKGGEGVNLTRYN